MFGTCSEQSKEIHPNFHGYHLEHLCGLPKSSPERQKVANNYGS